MTLAFVCIIACSGYVMYLQAPDSEQRLSKLQAQLDRLSLTLNQWQQTLEQLQPMESRLSQLTQQCGEILNRRTATDDRHERAVEDVESRLTEWIALRQSYEDPIKQLREQVTSLGEICASAASSVSGFGQTESRFAALETDLHLRLNQLSCDLQALVAELRGAAGHRPASLTGATPTWPLEGVMRLHGELREGSEGQSNPSPAGGHATTDEGAAALSSRPVSLLPEATEALAGRLESLERAATAGKEEFTQAVDRTERQRRRWYVAFAVLALGVIGAGALTVSLQRRVDTKLNEAAARVTAAEQQAKAATELADRQVVSTREEADRQIAEARQTALKAQIIGDVLAAPDLARFNLTSGPTGPRAYAQLLWSRSRGLVFSAARLPDAPEGTTYQIWLFTSAEPVSAGLFVPDSAGRVTLATDNPPTVPRQVTGVGVTLEPTGGRQAPSGPTSLARVP